jgi:HK97 family phage prohead protease
MSKEAELIEMAACLLKDAGLATGGAQATVADTGFTPTFGGMSICDKCKKKKDCKVVEKDSKMVSGKCDQGWGVCNSCEICKDEEKHLAFSHLELIKSADGIYIAGYASPWVIDDEGHRIERPALGESLEKFMFQPMFRNVMLSHTGIQVGYVVPETVDSSGKVHKTRVDDKGLFVVCRLRDDILPGKELIESINKGEVDSFSIRGRGLQSEFKCEGGRCFWSVTKLELYEITVCKRGVNPDAKFVLLKSKDRCGAVILEGIPAEDPMEALADRILDRLLARLVRSGL